MDERKIRVVVCGACGRMGSKILELISKEVGIMGVLGVEKKDYLGMGKALDTHLITSEDLDNKINPSSYNVIIDFTNPEAAMHHLRIAAAHHKPIVIGTTGFSNAQKSELADTEWNIPRVVAPNMSVGVNLLFKLVREAARILSNYEVEIIEAHHNQKKDAPSGTALKLAQDIAYIRGYDEPMSTLTIGGIRCGREGMTWPRKFSEIGVHSIRAGDIIGEHTIIFAGNSERVELISKVHTRDAFAQGAIKAAKWVIDKTPGLYSMEDVLADVIFKKELEEAMRGMAEFTEFTVEDK